MVGVWWVGGVKLKLKLSPAFAELGKNLKTEHNKNFTLILWLLNIVELKRIISGVQIKNYRCSYSNTESQIKNKKSFI
jgi:hypothetical protein